VLDTNVLVSALLFRSGSLSWMRAAWQQRLFIPLADRETTDELVRVLGYRKFGLEARDIEAVLGLYLPYAELVPPGSNQPRITGLRDPHDMMFLRLAFRGDASVLVSGDGDLLAAAGRFPFMIEPPARFRTRFDPKAV
jgi:putative PIN family toxin of toxin-antitoxin system